MLLIVAIIVSLGVGAYAQMARQRSFILWSVITFAVLFLSELVVRSLLVLLLAGITETTALSLILYISFGAMVWLCVAILPAAPPEVDR